MKEYLSLTIKAILVSFIFVGTLYFAERLFRKPGIEYPQIQAGNFINVASKITSFTTGTGARVEVYNNQGIIIVVAEKNGVVSVSIK
jgi:hypothetical protein